VDNDTLRRILDNPEAMAAVERIEGWRSLGDNIIETIINKSEKVKELKNKGKGRDLTADEKKQLSDEEKEYKSKRKLVQEVWSAADHRGVFAPSRGSLSRPTGKDRRSPSCEPLSRIYPTARRSCPYLGSRRARSGSPS
jgi:hypothetical protein